MPELIGIDGGAPGLGGTFVDSDPISPNPNEPVLVAVFLGDSDEIPPTPTLSGCNLTWENLTEFINTEIGDDDEYEINLYIGFGASPTPGAVRISYGDTSVDYLKYKIARMVDFDMSQGVHGVVQCLVAKGSGTTALRNLASFQQGENWTVGISAHDGNDVFSPGSGFSVLTVPGEPSFFDDDFQWEYKDSADTSVDASISGSELWIMIALELAVATEIIMLPSPVALDLHVAQPVFTHNSLALQPSPVDLALVVAQASFTLGQRVLEASPVEMALAVPSSFFEFPGVDVFFPQPVHLALDVPAAAIALAAYALTPDPVGVALVVTEPELSTDTLTMHVQPVEVYLNVRKPTMTYSAIVLSGIDPVELALVVAMSGFDIGITRRQGYARPRPAYRRIR